MGHQLLAYTDDVHLQGNNVKTIEENTEALIDGSKEVSLEIKVEIKAAVFSQKRR
jgi:subtilase family serine protease